MASDGVDSGLGSGIAHNEAILEYLARLEEAGLRQQAATPYGWDTVGSGVPFDRRMRRIYRAGLVARTRVSSARR